MSRVNGEIVFSARIAVDKEQAEHSKVEMLKYQKEKMACELGTKIAKEKGWDEREEGGNIIAEINLYVFTPQELKDFVDLKS